MAIIAFLIAVSGSLAIVAVVFFLWLVRQKSHEHADRLTFLPLEENPTEQAKAQQ